MCPLLYNNEEKTDILELELNCMSTLMTLIFLNKFRKLKAQRLAYSIFLEFILRSHYHSIVVAFSSYS